MSRPLPSSRQVLRLQSGLLCRLFRVGISFVRGLPGEHQRCSVLQPRVGAPRLPWVTAAGRSPTLKGLQQGRPSPQPLQGWGLVGGFPQGSSSAATPGWGMERRWCSPEIGAAPLPPAPASSSGSLWLGIPARLLSGLAERGDDGSRGLQPTVARGWVRVAERRLERRTPIRRGTRAGATPHQSAALRSHLAERRWLESTL